MGASRSPSRQIEILYRGKQIKLKELNAIIQNKSGKGFIRAADISFVVPSQTLAMWRRKGLLEGKKVGGRWFYSRDGLLRLIDQPKQTGSVVRRPDEH